MREKIQVCAQCLRAYTGDHPGCPTCTGVKPDDSPVLVVEAPRAGHLPGVRASILSDINKAAREAGATVVIAENQAKEQSTVDLLCAGITTKLLKPAAILQASQAEILTALLKTSKLYAGYVGKKALADQLGEIVDAYEKAIAASTKRPPAICPGCKMPEFQCLQTTVGCVKSPTMADVNRSTEA